MDIRSNQGLSSRLNHRSAFINGPDVDRDSNGSLLVVMGFCLSLVISSSDDRSLSDVYSAFV